MLGSHQTHTAAPVAIPFSLSWCFFPLIASLFLPSRSHSFKPGTLASLLNAAGFVVLQTLYVLAWTTLHTRRPNKQPVWQFGSSFNVTGPSCQWLKHQLNFCCNSRGNPKHSFVPVCQYVGRSSPLIIYSTSILLDVGSSQSFYYYVHDQSGLFFSLTNQVSSQDIFIK